jgi:hypothetical protein
MKVVIYCFFCDKISILELSETTLYVGTDEGSILEFELGLGPAVNKRSKHLGAVSVVMNLTANLFHAQNSSLILAEGSGHIPAISLSSQSPNSSV